MLTDDPAVTSFTRTGPSRRQFLGGTLIAANALLRDIEMCPAGEPAPATRLWIGSATTDITPDLPVALTGFQTVRLTRTIQSRLTANVLALNGETGTGTIPRAVWVKRARCFYAAMLLPR